MKRRISKSRPPPSYPACFCVTVSSAPAWSNQMVSHKTLDMNISYSLETVFSSLFPGKKRVDLRLSTTGGAPWHCAVTQAKASWALLSSRNGESRDCFRPLEEWSWNFPLRGKKTNKPFVRQQSSSLAVLGLPFLDIMWKVWGTGSMQFLIHWISSWVNLTPLSQWTLCFHSNFVWFQLRPFLTIFLFSISQSLATVFRDINPLTVTCLYHFSLRLCFHSSSETWVVSFVWAWAVVSG